MSNNVLLPTWLVNWYIDIDIITSIPHKYTIVNLSHQWCYLKYHFQAGLCMSSEYCVLILSIWFISNRQITGILVLLSVLAFTATTSLESESYNTIMHWWIYNSCNDRETRGWNFFKSSTFNCLSKYIY
jgi:hypothetical protein